MRARTLHKWIGIFVGIILLMWAVTGVALMLPGHRPDARPQPIPLTRATVSPREALAIALGDSAGTVRAASLIRIHQHVAYRIDGGRRPILVDAETGQRIQITAALAEAVTREALGRPAGKIQVETVRKHDALYSTGSLPAWRVTVDGMDGPPSHVSQLDGTFIPGGSRSRFRALMHELHNFAFIQRVVAPDWFFRTLAIVAGVVAIISIVTGYWLALPPRQAARRARSTEPMSIR